MTKILNQSTVSFAPLRVMQAFIASVSLKIVQNCLTYFLLCRMWLLLWEFSDTIVIFL